LSVISGVSAALRPHQARWQLRAIMDINTSLQLESALGDIDLGHYTWATASLTILLNAHENDAVAYHRINIELVRAHFMRSAFVAALEAINKSISKFPASFLEDLEMRQQMLQLDESCIYLVLRMQKALIASLIDGSLDSSVEISDRIAKLLPPYTPHELSIHAREIASSVQSCACRR
jgi:hypothetical protein